ncbi:Carbamoyltransferase C-terminus [Lentzea aerocolonigenes]|nr:Carbamoyltransferase C-terminus [Lentzea aerocolonigenes]
MFLTQWRIEHRVHFGQPECLGKALHVLCQDQARPGVPHHEQVPLVRIALVQRQIGAARLKDREEHHNHPQRRPVEHRHHAAPADSSDNGRALGEKASANRAQLFPGMSEADLIATFQAYLGDRLLRGMSSVLHRRFPGRTPNLVLSGGCALNIKWNNRLRSSGLFADVWVPPFPNDAGAAIGTASCEMFGQDGRLHLDWNVYSGPGLVASPTPPGWEKRPCDERELAELLHTTGEPVVVLSGRAEIGPRALGNRSILATATSRSA